MKILAIRGKNLASLSSEFALDFCAEPLASAGLFAITGPTGAGKSTLLDALCVALYERTPRLARASARSEAVPDVGESGLASADARTILRRGAGEGYAEVDFVGCDAVAYRARWSVRRARNNAAGKLQTSDVTLERIADRQILGDHRKGETLRLIESKVGLSFEQFTRAVLLAQNDFATFLKASDDERAELLQTLTGTGTFAEISKLAYARMKDEKSKLDGLVTQLNDQAPLPAEVRAGKQTDVKRHAERLSALDSAKTLVDNQLRWHADLARLREAAAKAGQSLATAQAVHGAAEARYRQLALIDAVQPARSLCADLERIGRDVAGSLKTVGERENELLAARRRVLECEAEVETAGQGLAHAEQVRSAALPQIDAAKALDARIDALAPQHLAAGKAHDDAARHLEQVQGKRESTQRALQRAHDERVAGERWLGEHAAQQALAENWPRWETLFAQALPLQRERAHCGEQAKILGLREGDGAAALQQAQAQHARQLQAHTGACAALAARSAAWQSFDGEAMARCKQKLEARRDQLGEAAAQWAALEALQQRQGECAKQGRDTAALIAQCGAALLACEAQRAQLEPQCLAAENAYNLAQLAASQSAEALRAALLDGQPCPVCGGVDHPYATHSPQADAILSALRENLLGVRKALADVLAHTAASASKRDAAEQQLRRIADDIAVIERTLAEQRLRWTTLALSADFAELAQCGEIGEDAWGGWLVEQQAAVRMALEQSARVEGEYRAAGRQKDAAQADVDRAQQALGVAQQALARSESELASTRHALDSARQRLARSETQLDETLSGLDGAFPDAHWRDDWLRDAEAHVARCRRRAGDWLGRHKQVGDLAAQIDALKVALEGQSEAVAKAVADAGAARARLDAGEAQLKALRSERQALFSGRAIKDVEGELAGAVDAAKRAHSQRQVAWQAAGVGRTRLDEALRQAGDLLAQQRLAQGAAVQIHAAWLAQFNEAHLGEARELLSADALDALLAVDTGWIDDERAALQQLTQAVESAQTEVKVHAQTILEHEKARPGAGCGDQADGSAEVTAENLVTALAKVQADIAGAADMLANVKAELVADDACRQRAQALGAAIARQESATRVWSQLGELIGSADGKKFRNFAQQMTLDILLGYGNRHLESLSRRYRLERIKDSLGLLVVDQDMGDEVRSVHSLSGGESFLVSLALALGLASLSSHRVRVESLFIDEGFGSLDADSLRIAMDALDSLQAQGRKVGVISHVAEMNERIGVRVQVTRQSGGQSRIAVV